MEGTETKNHTDMKMESIEESSGRLLRGLHIVRLKAEEGKTPVIAEALWDGSRWLSHDGEIEEALEYVSGMRYGDKERRKMRYVNKEIAKAAKAARKLRALPSGEAGTAEGQE